MAVRADRNEICVPVRGSIEQPLNWALVEDLDRFAIR